MKLLTSEIIKKLEKYPLYSQDKKEKKEVIVKFFGGGSWTWYVVEGNKMENGDWEFFGYVKGIEDEWGYFTLSELQSIKFPPFNLGIERDMYFGKQYIDIDGNLSKVA